MSSVNQVVDTLMYRNELNPKFWINSENPKESVLKDNVRAQLMKISDEFIEYLDLDLFVSDITMTGSLANLNWSEFSDVDLHFMLDFNQLKDNEELYKEYFNLKKTLFNSTHDIKIYGHDVEVYIQDILELHQSSGVYSVLHDRWIQVPKKENVEINKDVLKQKIKAVVSQLEDVFLNLDDEEPKKAIKILDNFKDKLKKYRSAGLTKEGEKSYENLVFKYLRRAGYIQKIFDTKNKIIDQTLSLESYSKKKDNL
jgi:hypothetical protein